MEETSVFYRPNTLEMFSPLYGLSHCNYKAGNCLVSNMTLMWIPECKIYGECGQCYYSRTRRIPGTYTKNAFLSNDCKLGKSVSLTLSEAPPRMLSCEGDAIRLTDQGFAISEADYTAMQSSGTELRVKRETATTEELASELTAAELKLMQLVEHLFEIQCRSGVRETNPTRMARKSLKRNDVMARWKTDQYLEIFPCAVIPSKKIKLRSVKEKCYKFVPVLVEIPQLGWVNAFIDRTLSIISNR